MSQAATNGPQPTTNVGAPCRTCAAPCRTYASRNGFETTLAAVNTADFTAWIDWENIALQASS